MKHYAFIKNNQVVSRGAYSNPDHAPMDAYDKVIEITEELFNEPTGLKLTGNEVRVDEVKKAERDALTAEVKRIEAKVKKGDALTNNETALYVKHVGSIG